MIFQDWLSGLAKYLIREWIMKTPSFTLRKLFLKGMTKSIGKDTYIAMGIDIRGRRGNITIGNNTIINSRVLLDCRGGDLLIGNNVDIGQETNIWTLEHDPNDDNHGVKGAGVTIDDYVWIATRVTILPGVKIGRGAVVASNSVVTKDVPEMAIVAGVPAKQIGKRDNKLTYKLTYKPWFL